MKCKMMAITEDQKRDETLRALEREVDDDALLQSSSTYRSWVRGDCDINTTTAQEAAHDDDDDAPSPSAWRPTRRCRFFDRHGFLHIPDFASVEEVQSMKSHMERLVSDEWDPSDRDRRTVEVFRTDRGQVDAQGRSDYFLDSASRVHFFAERDAIDGEAGGGGGVLREEYRANKIAALNKAGHGMHVAEGPFRDYARSGKVARLLRELGWVHPVAPQSMYIFKQARIGGEVTSHQDSTFLHTSPRQTCVGLWLALDDATTENGCMWVRPGSHRESVRRQFIRNPRHFGESLSYDNNCADGNHCGGDRGEPQMMFRRLRNDGEGDDVTWDGALPEDLTEAGFIPVPCKAGDLLAFPGELDHLSLPNHSDEPRHTFQLHCIEGEDAGVMWSRENWLQYTPGVPFMKL